MVYILILLFLTYLFLLHLANSARVFKEHELFKKKWHKYRFGFTIKEVKDQIKLTTDPIVRQKLIKSLRIQLGARYILYTFLVLFVITIFFKSE